MRKLKLSMDDLKSQILFNWRIIYKGRGIKPIHFNALTQQKPYRNTLARRILRKEKKVIYSRGVYYLKEAQP